MFMTVLICLAFQAFAQDPWRRPRAAQWDLAEIILAPTWAKCTAVETDQGLAGMLQWLDTPVPNFPWYSSGGSFYSQPYSDTTFSPYREYYTTTGTPVVGGIISNPTRFDITQKTPSSVYYGAGVGLPYYPVCSHSAIQDQ